MSQLRHQCPDCQGFLPPQVKICPNCQTQIRFSLRRRLRQALQLLLGTSVMMTLAACYGSPPPMPDTNCGDTPDSTEPCPSPSPSESASESPTPEASPSASPSSETQAGSAS